MRRLVLVIVLIVTGACRKPVESRLAEGDAAAQTGRWDEALTKWQAARELEPESSLAHARLGAALWNLNRRDEAAAAWREAVRLQPSSEEAHEGLARVALDARDAGAALEELNAVSEPSGASFNRVKVRALLLNGEGERAMELAASFGDDAESRYLVGSAQLATGRYAEAQATFDALSRSHPTSPLGAYGLARTAAAQNRQVEALSALATSKSLSGAAWRADDVAADPAFSFLLTAPEFKALVGR
ncbi:MAG: tetratricopeptide repeat protein [Archangium sp.]